tara:strand:- start:239 stop:625 length:387 start_codon:yes stop_codon:yes gene_type:complete
MSQLNWGEANLTWGNNPYTWEGAHQVLMSQLTWEGALLTWGDNPYTWGDIQLVTEAAEVIITGGDTGLEEWLRQEPKKKKRLIKLVATVGGQQYVETKEVEEVKVNIEDVELLIKEIFVNLIMEKKDV